MGKLPSVLPESLDHSLENLSKPLTVNMGKTFGDIWFLVFGFISKAAEKRRIKQAIEYKKFKQETEARILNISPDDLKEPNIQIATQALEESKYCIEEEILRHMFSELIASSMMKSRESIVHPSFASILKQMSPSDAISLLRFKDSPELPLIKLTEPTPESNGYRIIFSNVWERCDDLDSLNRSRSCLESLSRLGLIEISYLEYLTNTDFYDNLYTDKLKELAYELAENADCELSMTQGYAKLTQLGINFIACVCS